MEAILQFDEKDYERDHMIDERKEEEDNQEVTSPQETQSDEQSSSRLSDSSKLTDSAGQEQQLSNYMSMEELFQANLLKVDEEWRDIYNEARFYPDELNQEIFEPNSPWSSWQKTDEFEIQTRVSDRGFLCCYSRAKINVNFE